MLKRGLVRFYSSSTRQNYFSLFPKLFPNGGPPKDSFAVDLRKLKKTYLLSQSTAHPDAQLGSEADSKILNKAYETLASPLKRAQHSLMLQGIDLTSDGVSNKSKELASKDSNLLIDILEIHEQLEECENKEELKTLKSENDLRIKECEQVLTELFAREDWENAAVETIKLNYWFNIKNAIKEWEPGKPVNLTH